MPLQTTIERLREMRLRGIADALVRNSSNLNSSPVVRGTSELPDQNGSTGKNGARLYFSKSEIPWPHAWKMLTTSIRGLDRTVMRLAACQWVSTACTSYCWTHRCGKTFLRRLGNAACRHGYTVRYYRVPRLLAELATAVDSLRRIPNTHPTAVDLDDWGLAPISVAESRDLLEVIDDRTQARSTVIASQLPIETWHSVIGDATVADAILDRLVHGAHKLNLKGESMRKIANLQTSELTMG